MFNNKLTLKLKKIKLLVTDFDGVHTDGFVYVNHSGEEFVRCSRKDGLGIEMVKNIGILVVAISKESNLVVEARCSKLGIECYQNIQNGEKKLDILKRIVEENNLSQDNVLYIGDDINDKPCLDYSGVSVTVFDHHPLLKTCDYITKNKGGDNAIREVCELVLKALGKKIEF